MPHRRLEVIVQRWSSSLLSPRRRHDSHVSALPRRSARWLRLLAGVMVMAALFAVLISAAEPEHAAAASDGGAGPALVTGFAPAR